MEAPYRASSGSAVTSGSGLVAAAPAAAAKPGAGGLASAGSAAGVGLSAQPGHGRFPPSDAGAGHAGASLPRASAPAAGAGVDSALHFHAWASARSDVSPLLGGASACQTPRSSPA